MWAGFVSRSSPMGVRMRGLFGYRVVTPSESQLTYRNNVGRVAWDKLAS